MYNKDVNKTKQKFKERNEESNYDEHKINKKRKI